MDYVKLIFSRGSYTYKDSSVSSMDIIGIFLSNDVRCSVEEASIYSEWAINDSLGMGTSGNLTWIEKEGDYLFLSDLNSEEKFSEEIKISRNQFIKLLSDWEEKVCKHKPREVIIKHENDQFVIETSD